MSGFVLGVDQELNLSYLGVLFGVTARFFFVFSGAFLFLVADFLLLRLLLSFSSSSPFTVATPTVCLCYQQFVRRSEFHFRQKSPSKY